MPKIYAEPSVTLEDVSDIKGREIRKAYAGNNITYVGLNGKEAAAYVNYRDYRFLLAARLLAEAITKTTGQKISVPGVIANVLENNNALNVDASSLRQFSENVAQYAVVTPTGDVTRPSEEQLKLVAERERLVPLQTAKKLTNAEKDVMKEYLQPNEVKELMRPGFVSTAMLVASEDAKFVEELRSVFSQSTSEVILAKATSQTDYDAIILESMVAEYNRVTGAAMPADIAEYYTRFNGVRDAAGIQYDDAKDGYVLTPLAA